MPAPETPSPVPLMPRWTLHQHSSEHPVVGLSEAGVLMVDGQPLDPREEPTDRQRLLGLIWALCGEPGSIEALPTQARSALGTHLCQALSSPALTILDAPSEPGRRTRVVWPRRVANCGGSAVLEGAT